MISVKTSNGVILKGEELENILKVVSTVFVRGIPWIFSSGEESNKIIHQNEKIIKIVEQKRTILYIWSG